MPFEMDSTISIHAPARGATPCAWCACRGWPISIHAPREGGDKFSSKHSTKTVISIHAP